MCVCLPIVKITRCSSQTLAGLISTLMVSISARALSERDREQKVRRKLVDGKIGGRGERGGWRKATRCIKGRRERSLITEMKRVGFVSQRERKGKFRKTGADK